MIVRLLLGCMMALLLVLPTAGTSAADGSQTVDQQILGGVKTDMTDYKVGETVRITFIVENRGREDAILRFSSSQRFDIWVESNGRPAWRWSKGRMFTQALGSVKLGPGEQKTYQATWDQKDDKGNQISPGTYSIFAQLTTAQPRPTPVKTDIAIAVAPAAVKPTTVDAIVKNAKTAAGTLVQLQGTYLGFHPDESLPSCRGGQPVTRSDWAFKDLTGCIYVTGIYRLDPTKDVGKTVTVSGYVRVTSDGQAYIQATNMTAEN